MESYDRLYEEKMEHVEAGDWAEGYEIITKPCGSFGTWAYNIRFKDGRKEQHCHLQTTLMLSHRILNDRRMGEIALVLEKHRLQKEGIRFSDQFKREFGNVAKASGVPYLDILRFYEKIAREFMDETFSDSSDEKTE